MTIGRFLGISLLAVVAGCNQTDKPADLGVTSDPSGVQAAAQQQTQVAVIQGSCPQVFLRDGTAVLQRFGKGAKDDDGDRIAMSVKVGDRVLFGKYSGQTVKVDGDELLVMKEDDLFAVVEK